MTEFDSPAVTPCRWQHIKIQSTNSCWTLSPVEAIVVPLSHMGTVSLALCSLGSTWKWPLFPSAAHRVPRAISGKSTLRIKRGASCPKPVVIKVWSDCDCRGRGCHGGGVVVEGRKKGDKPLPVLVSNRDTCCSISGFQHPLEGGWQTPSTGLRHPSFNFGGRCRKAMLGVWEDD